MFDIILQRNLSEPERIVKTVEDVYPLKGTLKDGTSIIDPQILIGGTDMSQIRTCNYMTIPDFGRSYFIRTIDSVTNSLILVSGHVDVLSSFKDSLLTNKAIVNRQQNSPLWNLYLNDGSLRTYQNRQVVTKPFPNAFTNIELILAVAGGS